MQWLWELNGGWLLYRTRKFKKEESEVFCSFVAYFPSLFSKVWNRRRKGRLRVFFLNIAEGFHL